MSQTFQKISVLEKIGYSLGDLAANLVFQTLITYLAYFYTDIYGLKNTDASIIMLSVGLVAAFIFNPIIGLLADRTRSKWGKFRPWILFTAIPLGVIALLAFSTPNFSYKGKLIYAAVTYSLLLMLYASSNLPYSALSGVITGDMGERNSISSYRFVAVMFAQFFVQVFMLPIIEYAGHGDKAVGIESVMTWMAIIGTVMLLITFFTTRERIVPGIEQKSSTGDMGERNSISSYRFVAVMFAQFFVQVFMLPIIEYAGKGDKAVGIEAVMTWLAAIGTIMLLITFFTTRERIIPRLEQKSSIKDDLSDLSKNKPWLIMLILTILVFITLAMKGGAYVYYFNNYVDKQALTDLISPLISDLSAVGINFFGSDPVAAGFGLFNAGGIIFMIIGISFSKKLADKYGKRDVYKYGLLTATIFVLIFIFFRPDNVILMFVSQILHGFSYVWDYHTNSLGYDC